MLLKNKKFLIGFTFIIVLTLLSVMYSIFLYKIIPDPPKMIYGENNKLTDAPPYPPSFKFLLGVDRFGGDVFWKVIDGAKYTIAIAVIVSLFRIILSLIGSLIYTFYLGKLRFFIEAGIRAYRFIPAVILAIIFFVAVNMPDITPMELVIQQTLILVIIGIVPLVGYLAAETRVFLDFDFISCSRILGASKGWIIKAHIFRYLRPRLFILFTQQVAQTLLLLVHLGVFQIVIGKEEKITSFNALASSDMVTLSLSNEWSGLIGLSYQELMLDKWIIVGPSIGFVLTIYSFRLMGKGIEESFTTREEVKEDLVIEDNREIKPFIEKKPFDLKHN
ncbi:ABC transporter permease [Rossellomorea vietnamensis]|uniref:Peptide ABC transporter permease n=1 Tax=Rossellomorea aquimaris TaxID=189382 RepID=A0A5D4UAC8_9BACI|nr:peptide ABC transporter permease [Rossellomorea aquimaris]TYS84274.1 peptide ABC transporter permease [Rossellomorea aquimaris]